MIRDAQFGDVLRLHDLMHELYERSVFVDVADFDGAECKRLMLNAIRHQGQARAGGSLVQVTETDNVVEGFIVGLVQRVYHVGVQLEATDLFYVGSKRAVRREMVALYDNFLAWAFENERVVQVVNGATGALGSWRPTEALYRKRGLEQFGVIYRKVKP